jgi:hypothetical protein
MNAGMTITSLSLDSRATLRANGPRDVQLERSAGYRAAGRAPSERTARTDARGNAAAPGPTSAFDDLMRAAQQPANPSDRAAADDDEPVTVIAPLTTLNRSSVDMPADERWSLRGAMRSQDSRPPVGIDRDTWDAARQQAGELVALSLVQPILGEMRETNNAWGPFKPGAWEKRLGPILDAEVAKDVVNSSSWGLIDQLASNFLGRPVIHDHRATGENGTLA